MTRAEGALFFMGGIALIVWAVILLDWWGRRGERRSPRPPIA